MQTRTAWSCSVLPEECVLDPAQVLGPSPASHSPPSALHQECPPPTLSLLQNASCHHPPDLCWPKSTSATYWPLRPMLVLGCFRNPLQWPSLLRGSPLPCLWIKGKNAVLMRSFNELNRHRPLYMIGSLGFFATWKCLYHQWEYTCPTLNVWKDGKVHSLLGRISSIASE